MPDWAESRWCDVFEIRDFKIQRCFIYLDPDYAGADTARYPWLKEASPVATELGKQNEDREKTKGRYENG